MTPPLTSGAAWMDGAILPIAEAKIGVTDWGLTRSDITYDVVPVIDGAFFRLEVYLERFAASMASLRLDPGISTDDIRAALHEMVAATGLRDAYVAMVCSRGKPSVIGSRDPRDCVNHFYAWAVPWIDVIPQEVQARGARLWVAQNVRRIPVQSVNPRAKNYHWGDFTSAVFEAKDEGFDTAILLDFDGNITEGPGFNVLGIKDGCVFTPETGCLEGVTRRTVLEIAAEAGLRTEIRTVTLDEFLEADEVFASTTAGGVMPVTQVGARIYGNGAPGEQTMRIKARYRIWARNPAHRDAIAFS